MKRLIHLLTLLFFVIHLNSNAQTNIQQDWRVNPLLKQVDAKYPGLTIFGRKEQKVQQKVSYEALIPCA